MAQHDAMFEFEKTIKELELENQLNLMEYVISPTFPPKPPPEYAFLLDCRMKMYVYESTSILQGETKYIATSTRVAPDHGWSFLYVIPNPSINLIINEEFVQPSATTMRIFIRVSNLSAYPINISKGTCIGHMLLR